jgi:hypothetical protein
MDISKKLAELKIARDAAANYHAALKRMLDEVKASDEFSSYADSAKHYDDMVFALEEEIKLKALDEYNGTKNKHPFEKVTVKIFKTFKILDAEKVKIWAWENLPAAFKLDEAKIKTYVGSFGEVPGTETGEEPRVQIALEL